MKLISFYLPQFHTIPENDAWWGEGFTEWTNVKRGKPFYKNHYQPRIPLNHDYYDLSDSKIMERHMKLAKKYGIQGFCFYHYYFTGKKLLELPLENLLKNKKADLPFCLAWANQSWERTWYKKDASGKMLLKQTYGNEEEWTEHFHYLLPFFKDKRYITCEGMPVFLIYLPQDFPRINKMISLWNRLAKENGIPGIYFTGMNTIYKSNRTITGLNAMVDFEPLRTLRDISSIKQNLASFKKDIFEKTGIKKCQVLNRILANNLYSFDEINKIILNRKQQNKITTFSGAFPGWDNTARKDESGLIIRGSTPKKFERYLSDLIYKEKEKEFIFINAWNEWSEGAYLEPDERYGYAYLSAVKRATESLKNLSENNSK